MIELQLSPETPLARDGCRATRSVARAGTTHHLATGLHETEGYFLGRPLVKGETPAKIRCIAFRKVINGNKELSRLRGCRGRPDQRGGLDGIKLGPAFVEIGFTQVGDLILFRTGALAVLVVKHVNYFHSLRIHEAER